MAGERDGVEREKIGQMETVYFFRKITVLASRLSKVRSATQNLEPNPSSFQHGDVAIVVSVHALIELKVAAAPG